MSLGNHEAWSQAGLGLDPGAALSPCHVLLWKDLLLRVCELLTKRCAVILLLLDCERILTRAGASADRGGPEPKGLRSAPDSATCPLTFASSGFRVLPVIGEGGCKMWPPPGSTGGMSIPYLDGCSSQLESTCSSLILLVQASVFLQVRWGRRYLHKGPARTRQKPGTQKVPWKASTRRVGFVP